MKTSIPPFRITFALACFALLPTAHAISPPPDGGYPGGNTAEGQNALSSLTIGLYNTALGLYSLQSLTDGSFCTGVGAGTLLDNTGDQNTAIGAGALLSNTTGLDNTATGEAALFFNTTGSFNTANGKEALLNNTTGSDNTANGGSALRFNTTGINNTAAGALALFGNTTGSSNIALGLSAGANITTGSNNIDIGNLGVAGESATIRIGSGNQTNTFIAGVNGTAVTGTGVVVSASGQLGVATSSARFKYEIKPMGQASEALLALKPVTFRYKKELDPEGVPQFGLVAEEVAKTNPDLVVRDKERKPYTVRYDAVNAMLLNEFLKEHRKVEQLEKQIEALTAGLQKVSAQLEASKPAPQVVKNNH